MLMEARSRGDPPASAWRTNDGTPRLSAVGAAAARAAREKTEMNFMVMVVEKDTVEERLSANL